jgi:hypothetical protein
MDGLRDFSLNNYVIILLLLCLAFLSMGLFQSYFPSDDLNYFQKSSHITGMATTVNAETTANIANYFAINASANLTSNGIIFNINSIPADNQNASANYDSLEQTGFYLTVEHDSNVNIDFCIKANASLMYGSNELKLGNYTWANSTTNDASNPSFGIRTALINDTYDNSTRNVAPSSSSYYRFWLSVPASQSPGTYSNKLNFKGIQTGNLC